MTRQKTNVILFLFLLAFLLWLLLRPEYELTNYQITNCLNLYVTKIVCWKMGKRSVAFAYGKYNEPGLPSDECFVNNYIGGRDSYYEVILTCQNDTILINYNQGVYESIGSTNKIISKPLTNLDYHKLKDESKGQLIRGE